MSLTSGSEIRLDTQVHFHIVGFEPNTTSLRQFLRLWNFRNLKHTRVKAAGGVLLTSRHRELNMFDPLNMHSTPQRGFTERQEVKQVFPLFKAVAINLRHSHHSKLR